MVGLLLRFVLAILVCCMSPAVVESEDQAKEQGVKDWSNGVLEWWVQENNNAQYWHSLTFIRSDVTGSFLCSGNWMGPKQTDCHRRRHIDWRNRASCYSGFSNRDA